MPSMEQLSRRRWRSHAAVLLPSPQPIMSMLAMLHAPSAAPLRRRDVRLHGLYVKIDPFDLAAEASLCLDQGPRIAT